VVAPALLGRAILSRPIQAYLGNQRFAGGLNVPTVGSAIAALLGTRQQAPFPQPQPFRASTPGSAIAALLAGR
jgi:hypothetical protein